MVSKTRHKGVLIVLAVLAAVLLILLFIRTDGFIGNNAEDLNSVRSTPVTQNDRATPADQASDSSRKQGEQAEVNENEDSPASQKKSPEEEAADQRAESTVSGSLSEDDDLETARRRDARDPDDRRQSHARAESELRWRSHCDARQR